MKRMRVYVDTSVFGGCFDDEFRSSSLSFFEMARAGEFALIISQMLVDELKYAPENVRSVLRTVPVEYVEVIRFSEEARRLRDAYLAARVVGKKRSADAYHVALATVAYADMILSWNFRHIVHFEKIRGFNAVNLREGYLAIEVHSPNEVV